MQNLFVNLYLKIIEFILYKDIVYEILIKQRNLRQLLRKMFKNSITKSFYKITKDAGGDYQKVHKIRIMLYILGYFICLSVLHIYVVQVWVKLYPNYLSKYLWIIEPWIIRYLVSVKYYLSFFICTYLTLIADQETK